MISRRKIVIAFAGAAFAWPFTSHAQSSDRVRRIGVLHPLAEGDSSEQRAMAALRRALTDLGWVEGRNLHIDARYLGGSSARAPELAAELVALKPDLIMSRSDPALRALLKATATIPIVFTLVADPVTAGLVSSLARPGGNATGFSNTEAVIGQKWLELAKEIVPGAGRIGVMVEPDTTSTAIYRPSVVAAAAKLGVAPIELAVRVPGDIESALAAAGALDALIVLPSVLAGNQRDAIVALAERQRLPAIYPFSSFAEAGGLMSFGIDTVLVVGAAAGYADRILRGARPGDLPVQQPTMFKLVINLKAARALGLTVSPLLLTRADEVIE